MSRFLLSRHAEQDLDSILEYLDRAPSHSAQRIINALQTTLHSIADQPLLGIRDSALSTMHNQEVRSRLMAPYRIYYRLGRTAPEIFAIVHGARDLSSLLAIRVRQLQTKSE